MIYPLNIHFTIGRFNVEATIKSTSYTWSYQDKRGSGFSHSDYEHTISIENLINEVMSYIRFETTN